MAGIKLAAGDSVVWFGALDPADAVVVTASGAGTALPGTDAGSVKVTPFAEYPGKGRATGGVRCHRFLKGEDVLVFAWAGAAPPRGGRGERRRRRPAGARRPPRRVGCRRQPADRRVRRAGHLVRGTLGAMRKPRGRARCAAARGRAGLRVRRPREVDQVPCPAPRRRPEVPREDRRCRDRARAPLSSRRACRASSRPRASARSSPPSRARSPWSRTASASNVPVRAVDGDVYIQFGGGWRKIDPTDFGAPDPADLFKVDGGLASLLSDVRGREGRQGHARRQARSSPRSPARSRATASRR